MSMSHSRSLVIPFFLAACGMAQPPAVSTLHSFRGAPSDGSRPQSGVTAGSGGVLYGTAQRGGSSNAGIVYSLTPPSPGGAWTETVLYNFTGPDGAGPDSDVALDGAGVLYGTTREGGVWDAGTVFSLAPPSAPGAAWTEAVLYSFAGGDDGAYPLRGVTFGVGGVLYGSTNGGGSWGAGTVFSLSPPAAPGAAWTEALLYTFIGPAQAVNPSGLVIGAGGVLYGATYSGAPPYLGNGTIFSLAPPTSPDGVWTQTMLCALTSEDDGPRAGLAIGSGGVLYGTSYGGDGSVFSVTPPAAPGDPWTLAVLYHFAGFADGSGPEAGVAIGPGGVLYGTTESGGSSNYGTVFSLAPPSAPGGSWTFHGLYSFPGGGAGEYPSKGTVTLHEGIIFGTTGRGGGTNDGTVYSLRP